MATRKTKKPSESGNSESGNAAPKLLKPAKRRVGGRLRNYFLTGIVITAPIGITVALSLWVINWIDSQIVPLIPPAYNPQTYVYEQYGIYVPGIGLIVVLIGLTFIGFIAAGLVGRVLVRSGENLLSRMPIVRGIYGALKQIFETVLKSSSRSFREVVLFEYPRRGIWAIGFITSETLGEVQNTTEEPVVNVFLPTTPNPTSGFLLFVPRGDLILLSMSIEEGIKMVISAGIVTPADLRTPEEVDKTQEASGARGFRAMPTSDLPLEPDTEVSLIPSGES